MAKYDVIIRVESESDESEVTAEAITLAEGSFGDNTYFQLKKTTVDKVLEENTFG